MSSWLIDPATAALTTALDGYARREEAIGANIANVDTPGYKAVSVDFESELAAAMSGTGQPQLAMNPPSTPPPVDTEMRMTNPVHLDGLPTGSTIPAGVGLGSQPGSFRQRVDGNGVDVDVQMTRLAETQLKYAATSRMLTGKLGQLKDVLAAR